MAEAKLSFLPWVREGLVAGITADEDRTPDQSGQALLSVALSVNDEVGPTVQLRMRGPGDVEGIDSDQIIRRDPAPGSIDFEPNCFASIEFDRPDFPWLFTPARADGQGRLRPWLCLVVVREGDAVVLGSAPDSPLASLHIDGSAIAAELPDLADCWAWAHAQTASPSAEAEVRSALEKTPDRALSRLVCPRLLAPSRAYLACLVPTFDLARKAGLGLPIGNDDLATLAHAWDKDALAADLPVYHHWRFRTGPDGDFKSLARKLVAREAPERLGRRTFSIARPGFGLPADFPANATLDLSGALLPINGEPLPAWEASARTLFQDRLAPIVNAPGERRVTEPGTSPLLAPPLYGRWPALRETARTNGSAWFDQLNLDPRLRAVAAFGTRVVQDQQEALMAVAWEQAPDLRQANQRLRQLQLSVAVGGNLHKRHFATLAPEARLRISAPAFARLSVGAGGPTLLGHLERSAFPAMAASTAMRRIGRERGPLGRRTAVLGAARPAPQLFTALRWGLQFNLASPTPAPPLPTRANVAAVIERIGAIGTIQVFAAVNEATVEETPGRPLFAIAPEGEEVAVAPLGGEPSSADSSDAAAFRAAAREHLAKIQAGRMGMMIFPAPPLEVGDLHGMLVAAFQPRRALVALAAHLVSIAGNASSPVATPRAETVGVDTVMAAPTFPTPMYEPLRDLSQDFLLPGIAAIEPESVIGLKTNRHFVESYMIGLNDEMARELLWRGFPTDQRGTCFAQFWDTRGAPKPRPDISPIHGWKDRAIASHDGAPAEEQFVVLVRSTLLRRYPNAIIYASRAVAAANGVRRPSAKADDEFHPVFRGAFAPDISFFGFDLTTREVTGADGSEGFFLIIQEHPTEPRFGVDVDIPPIDASHLGLGSGAPEGVNTVGRQWGRNSAQMAGILRRRPARIAMHASRFVSRDWLEGQN